VLSASARKLDDQVFTAARNLEEWREKRRALEAAWQKPVENMKTIGSVLQELQGANSSTRTDLYGALEYSFDWLSSQLGDEKYLIICSDLEHDTGNPTFNPPANVPDLGSRRVKLLFVSYGNSLHWKTLDAAWRNYFSRAASFEMLDSGRSSGATIVPPSAVPRQLANPLQTRNEN
jgi:hypothetical protein